jgi:uncharacterized protein
MLLLLSLALALFLATALHAEAASPEVLYDAIRRYDVPALESVLKEQPQLADARDDKGRSAVIRAVFLMRNGFVAPAKNEVLQALLKRHPQLDFWEMCAVGDSAGVRTALARDASLANAWHAIGWSPLHFAAFSGDVATTSLLLDRGAQIHARARTPFLNVPLQAALLTGQETTARLLLERGADPLVRQNGGFAPIHEAAFTGRRDLVDLLLEKGAEIDARGNDGRTAVSEAMRGGHTELAAYLRSRGGHDATITADLTSSPD